MGEHAYDYSSMSPSTPAAQHGGSSRHHAMVPSSKTTTTRPAIRIIHIVAPEIIKTDAANFRDLVQRLTGRQQQQAAAADHDDDRKAVTTPNPPSLVEEKPQKKRLAGAAPSLADDFVVQQENRTRKKIKCEAVEVEEGGSGGGDLDFGELWLDLNPGAFLSFLEEDIFQGMAPEFLQTPLGIAPRMDLIGECAHHIWLN